MIEVKWETAKYICEFFHKLFDIAKKKVLK